MHTWTASSQQPRATKNGWPTSPTSGRPKAAVCGCGPGSVLAPHRRLVDAGQHDLATVADALMMAVWRRGQPAALLPSLGPGQPIHQRALPGLAQRARHYLQHEPRRRGLGQLGDGELRQFTEDRTHRKKSVPIQGAPAPTSLIALSGSAT
jgi:hypothetical protein